MRDLRRAWIFLLEAKQGSSTFSYLLSPGLVDGVLRTEGILLHPPDLGWRMGANGRTRRPTDGELAQNVVHN